MEVVGAAASVAGLVTLLGQLLQSAKQLHEFWSSIKEVPESLRWLVDDLDMIREVLVLIKDQATQGSDTSGSGNAIPLLQKCISYVENLEGLVKPLQSENGASRRLKTWKSVKAVFATEKIKFYRDNLESAKVTLLLAQN